MYLCACGWTGDRPRWSDTSVPMGQADFVGMSANSIHIPICPVCYSAGLKVQIKEPA